MVKIGKMFKRGKGAGDDASVSTRMMIKRGKSPLTPPAAVTAAAPIPADAPAETSSVAASAMTKSLRKMSKKSSSNDESRDAAPAGFQPDPVGIHDVEDLNQFAASVSASGAEDEQSFGESESPSDDASAQYENGTVNTYDEDVSNNGSAEEESRFEEEEDMEEDDEVTRGTHDETATQDNTVASIGTAKGNELNQMSKKYFHKDVVLNSLEDGANNLVIRAMYFIPKPKADDHVVVKIEASTISARDCMKCKGHGLSKAMLPFVPGYEVVGTIQTLGHQPTEEGLFREGDRVAGVSTFGGGNSRFISIPSNRLTKISSNVKSTQAVCMIHDYMSALKALRLAKKNGSPFTGMNILITDGFSPVGQAVITLASMEGANMYCCADESKHSYLASLGAKCFVKNPEAWLPTATGTFDVVIDNSCIDSYSSSWFALTKRGSLVCLAPIYNIDNEDMPQSACGLVELTELQQKWAGLKAKYMMTQTSFLNTVDTYDDDNEQYKQDLRYLMFLLERGDIKPKVAERVSLDDVPDAQRLMQSGRANGTVVCVPWIEE